MDISNKTISKRIWIVAALALVPILLLIFLALRSYSGTDYSITKTQLSPEINFGKLVGNSLLSFNGFAFHKTDLTSGETITLYSGDKLPKPDTLYWADDKGVLVTFNESFYGSIIDTKLEERGLQTNTLTKRYTWYINFESKNINLVSNEPILKNGAWFSADEKKFYFIPDYSFYADREDTEINFAATSLYSYDVTQNKTSQIAQDLELTDVSNLSACTNKQYLTCIVGRSLRDKALRHIFAITPSGKVDSLLSSPRILHTANPRYYIELVTESEGGVNDTEGGDYGVSSVVIFDSQTNTKHETPIRLDTSNVVTSVNDQQLLLVVNDVDGEADYYSGQITEDSLKLSDRKKFQNELQSAVLLNRYVSAGDNGQLLAASTGGEQLLLHPTSVEINYRQAKQDEFITSLRECHDQEDIEYYASERLYRVFFVQDDTAFNKIEKFGNCLSSKSAHLLSERIYIGLTSPLDGRIVSD